MVFDALYGYLQGLRNVGVPPPLVMMLTLEGVYGALCAGNDRLLDRRRPVIEHRDLFLPECFINEYGADIDYQRAMKPAFDALWNAAGYPSAPTFSDDGQWTGKLR